MNFITLNLKGIYRTSLHSLMRDFYIPVLAHAERYDRAVGFFSSSMLIEAAMGLSGLVKNGGRMRLIIGHPLSDEDWDAVKKGTMLTSLQNNLMTELSSILENAGSSRSTHSLELLSWMVATGSLEIKYAFRKRGMYHEKIGIVVDSEGNTIVFQGSANESANALLPERNFESIAVYPSWKHEIYLDYGEPFENGFLNLWNNMTVDVLTVDVPSAFYEKLARYKKDQNLPPDLDLESALLMEEEIFISSNSKHPTLPSTLYGKPYKLKSHQEDALNRWRANSYNGIFALATGSGKTITVLHAAARFAEQNYPVVFVVAVPYQILGEQWSKVMELFCIVPIKAFISRDLWHSKLVEGISAFMSGASKFLAVVVVNDTLATEDFQEQLHRLPLEKLFFVGDECHHHSSSTWLDRIPLNAKFRIGLSATPWNPNQISQKQNLERLYGPVVATYSLKAALVDGVLSPYVYHCVFCDFDEDEAEEYVRLTAQIANLVAQDPHREDTNIQRQIQTTASRRTRLLGSLRSKNRQLETLLENEEKHAHTLVYCADGFHPLDKDSGAHRSIDIVTQYLSDSGWNVARITAGETVAERDRILKSFDDGFIQAIAAIRVLDEGFDIPGCRSAFILASTNSYRQYVQRRGRVLRLSPGKTFARIFDFIGLPSKSLVSSNQATWRNQVASELARVRDFIGLASNGNEQQFNINVELESRGLGTIYYSDSMIDPEELYGT